MSASASGPLGVLLMIAPLAAIPVLAIVGVPQFAPVSASPADDDDDVFADLGDPASPDAPSAEAPRRQRSADDLFAPVPKRDGLDDEADARAARDGRRPAQDLIRGRERNQRELPPPDALDQWEVRSDAPAKAGFPDSRGISGRSPADDGPTENLDADEGKVSAEGFDSGLLVPRKKTRERPGDGAPREATAPLSRGAAGTRQGPGELPADIPEADAAIAQLMAEQSGWQAAARRLKELGARKYRLEAQIEEQQFLFVCSFASPDNPRVVRRFEATADNPLEAVQNVLAQIDEWRSRASHESDESLILDEE